MTIKHLVLSGGGAAGFTIYGVIKSLHDYKYINIKEIESIHACSVGTMVALFILLSDSLDDLENYILNRPWEKIININSENILNLWHDKGILDETIIYKIFQPFLEIRELKQNVSLKEIYEKFNIELYFYTTNINSDKLESVCLSHKTHPELEILKAITMSSGFPFIFKPIIYNEGCYVDGALLNNFPIEECIEINKNIDETLGIQIRSNEKDYLKINDESNLANFIFNIIIKMYTTINGNNNKKLYNNVIICYLKNNSLSRWSEAISNIEIRKEYFEDGKKYAKLFLESKDC